MASPLAEIDWDNLESANLVTAMNLLELAYSERTNMAYLVTGALPRRAKIDLYPWLNNTPNYGRDDWPMIWSINSDFITSTLSLYLSQTKIDAALGTIVSGSGFRDNHYRLDEAQLFVDHGITEYPEMDIINPTDVKKWYDIITSLKKIKAEGAYHSGRNYIESYAEGIMRNPPVSPTYDQVWYGTIGPPVAQFTTDWALLYAGPQSKQSVSSYNTYFMQPLGASIRINSTSDKRARITKGYSRFDNADYAATGLTGLPESQAYGSYNYYQSGAGTYDPGIGTAYEIRELGAVTRSQLAGNVLERSIDVPDLNEPTFSSPYIDFTLDTLYSIYENWDVEGGFIYWTP